METYTLRSILAEFYIPPEFAELARKIAERAYQHGAADMDELRDKLAYWHSQAHKVRH